ncbi:MAG: hypothetical protein AAFN59_05910 [Pseudomonadota bacterium]
MTLSSIVFLVAGLFTLAVNLLIVAVMARDPVRGLAIFTHRPEQLPQVMTGRYAMFVVLTLLALFSRDPWILLGLLFGYFVASMADTYIYARAGHPYGKHAQAGAACVIGMVLCAIAIGTA